MSLRTWVIDGLLLTTLAPSGPAPFAQTDWQNPQRSGVRQLAVGGDNRLALIAPEGPVPFAQSDFPNPRGAEYPVGLRTWTNVVRLHLIGQDVLYGVPGEVQGFDWPNPRSPGRAQQHDGVNLLTSTLAAQAPADDRVPRAPLITRITARQVQEPDLAPNLLAGPLGTPAGLAPFAQSDWPVPAGKLHAVALRTWADATKLELQAAPAAAPFAQLEWTLPRGHAFPINLRTWTDPTKLNLLGQDQFFAGAGAGPCYDWPNPRGRTHHASLQRWEISGQLQTLFAPVTQAPFRQADFQNPRGRTYPNALLRLDDWLTELPWPFVNYDFPNPLPRRYAVALRTWHGNLLQSTLFVPPPAPFAQDEWPVPKGARAGIALRTWADSLKQQLLGQDQFYGAAGQAPATLDWPNPRGPRAAIVLRSWNFTLLQSTLAPFVPPPFTMHTWPVPIGRVPGIVLRTWLDQTKPQLRDAFFGAEGQTPANLDWPNPRGPRYAISLRLWSGNLLQSTLAPAAAVDSYELDTVVSQELRLTVSETELRLTPINDQ